MTKRIGISLLIIILVVAGAATWFFTRNRTASAQVYYPTTTVQKGTLASEVSGSGDLEPAIDQDITIDSDDAGKTVDSIAVSEGDSVKKGETLLTYTDGTTLVAPHAGTITSVSIYDDQRVTVGRAVMHLTSYANLNTVLQIDELDIPKVKIGQAVAVTVNAYPDKTFTGKVTEIANKGTDTNGVSTFDVTVHMDRSTGLKAGMSTTGDIVLKKKNNVLYIPSGAVHQENGQSYVYLATSGSSSSNGSAEGYGSMRRFAAMDTKRGKMVSVKTGMTTDQSIEILSGLEDGQSVQLTAITKQSGTATQTSTGQNSYRMMGGGQGFGGTGSGGFRQQGNGGGGGQ
ncbi:MAG: efflux RND transporter periplasmic adaptor subunit [Sporolactobacillus sp.]